MQASVTASAVLARAPEKPQTRGTCLAQMSRCPVAQVSKPAVSPISKSAELGNGLRVWKPAIQQTWKSAPRKDIPLCKREATIGLIALYERGSRGTGELISRARMPQASCVIALD